MSNDKPRINWTCKDCGLGIAGWSEDSGSIIICPNCNQRLTPKGKTNE